MRKEILLFSLIGCVILSGCQTFERKRQAGAAVELNGHYLYQSTLDSLTMGKQSEDSIRVTQQYISQWAKEILLYDEAKARTNKEIERLVEDYRRSLYVHAYEEYLVERRMPKTVPDSAVRQFYEQYPDRFKLDESIVRGILIVIPNDAPNIKKVNQWLEAANVEKTRGDALDDIEKYAYRYAKGYELFTDRWMTSTELLAYIPFDRSELENQLRQNKQIELQDSTSTYLLRVSEKHLRGEAMPLGYARPQIEQIILNARQVEFLQKERTRLYNEAIQSGKLRINEDK